jgi:N-acylneuraminate cytidylyltransferase
MRIAVIPARAGSKRIPGKNIREFAGKPMMAWSIEAARTCGLFDRIVVSTDGPEIAEVAKQWGAAVPFVRPEELSDDVTGTTAVIAHATRFALDEGWPLEVVACIYPTAPFLDAEDLKRGMSAMESGDWEFAFSATEFASPIYRSFRVLSAGGVEMVFPEHYTKRSQDLPVVYHDAGQFYFGRPTAWIDQKRIFERHSVPIILPRWRVQDIDDEADWTRAELMLHQIRQRP